MFMRVHISTNAIWRNVSSNGWSLNVRAISLFRHVNLKKLGLNRELLLNVITSKVLLNILFGIWNFLQTHYLYIYKSSWRAVRDESSPQCWPPRTCSDWRTCDRLAGTTYKWFSSDPRTSFYEALENIVPCTTWLHLRGNYIYSL